MIYLGTFLLSSFFIWISEVKIRKSPKSFQKICCVIGLLLPILLAAFRSLNIGTDVQVYGLRTFRAAHYANHFTDLNYYYQKEEMELGYILINFLLTRFTENIFWLFFVIEGLMIFFVYRSLKYYKYNISSDLSIAFGMLVYYLLFYNSGLNIMRQGIAMAIVLYAFRFIYEQKLVKYIIWVVIAAQFHVSAYIVIILYFIYYIMVIKKYQNLIYIVGIFTAISSLILPKLLMLVIQYNLLGSRFERYMNMGMGRIAITQLITRVPFVILLLYIAVKNKKKELYYLSTVLLLDIAFAGLRSSFVSLYRISLYFAHYNCFAYCEIAKGLGAKNKRIMEVLIVIFMVVLWYYQIVIWGSGETYPYQFR